MTKWLTSLEFEVEHPEFSTTHRRVIQDKDFRITCWTEFGLAGDLFVLGQWLRGFGLALLRPWRIGRLSRELEPIPNGITFGTTETSRLKVFVRLATVVFRLRIRRNPNPRERATLITFSSLNPLRYSMERLVKSCHVL